MSKLGLRPSSILNIKWTPLLGMLLHLHVGTLDLSLQPVDLSFGRWAFGPAVFSISNYDCFWTCMLRHSTCHSSIALVILTVSGFVMFVTDYIDSWPFLDLHVGTLNLSLQRWTCHFAAGPASQLHSWYQINIGSGLAYWDSGLVTPGLDLSFWSCAQPQIRNVSGLACWDIGLFSAALDLSFWSWAFGPASFSISNHCCL